MNWISTTCARSYTKSIKILIIGDSGVGKTNIISRFASKPFNIMSPPTIGFDFYSTDISQIKVNIWDSAGQETFRPIIRSYYKNSNGIILVYDITDLESFNNLVLWYKDVCEYLNINEVQLLVLGTKKDLENFRQVSQSQGLSFAKQIHAWGWSEISSALDSTDHSIQNLINEFILFLSIKYTC